MGAQTLQQQMHASRQPLVITLSPAAPGGPHTALRLEPQGPLTSQGPLTPRVSQGPLRPQAPHTALRMFPREPERCLNGPRSANTCRQHLNDRFAGVPVHLRGLSMRLIQAQTVTQCEHT